MNIYYCFFNKPVYSCKDTTGKSNKNRKNVAKLCKKFTEKGESEMACCKEGLLCVRWKDTKDVLLMSNCHEPKETKITRKKKDGLLQDVSCPVPIAFYNKYMEESIMLTK